MSIEKQINTTVMATSPVPPPETLLSPVRNHRQATFTNATTPTRRSTRRRKDLTLPPRTSRVHHEGLEGDRHHGLAKDASPSVLFQIQAKTLGSNSAFKETMPVRKSDQPEPEPEPSPFLVDDPSDEESDPREGNIGDSGQSDREVEHLEVRTPVKPNKVSNHLLQERSLPSMQQGNPFSLVEDDGEQTHSPQHMDPSRVGAVSVKRGLEESDCSSDDQSDNMRRSIHSSRDTQHLRTPSKRRSLAHLGSPGTPRTPGSWLERWKYSTMIHHSSMRAPTPLSPQVDSEAFQGNALASYVPPLSHEFTTPQKPRRTRLIQDLEHNPPRKNNGSFNLFADSEDSEEEEEQEGADLDVESADGQERYLVDSPQGKPYSWKERGYSPASFQTPQKAMHKGSPSMRRPPPIPMLPLGQKPMFTHDVLGQRRPRKQNADEPFL